MTDDSVNMILGPFRQIMKRRLDPILCNIEREKFRVVTISAPNVSEKNNYNFELYIDFKPFPANTTLATERKYEVEELNAVFSTIARLYSDAIQIKKNGGVYRLSPKELSNLSN